MMMRSMLTMTVAVLVLFAGTARAQVGGPSGDPAFQSFFTQVCQANDVPTTALGTRCVETTTNAPLGSLATASQSSLNPNQAVSAQDDTVERARLLARSLQERLEAQRDAASKERNPKTTSLRASPAAFAALGLEGVSAAAGPEESWRDRLMLLIGGRGATFDRDATSNERGYNGFFAGPQIGADYRVSDKLVLGGVFSYDRLDTDFDRDKSPSLFSFGHEGTRTANGYFITAFGSYNITDELYVDGSVGGGWTDYDLHRSVFFQPANTTITSQVPVQTKASPHGEEFDVDVGVGYGMYFGGFLVDPYVRTRYIYSSVASFNESGGNGLAMSYPSQDVKSLTTIVGLRSSYAISAEFGVFVPQLRFEWEHEFERDALNTSATYPLDVSGTDFLFTGENPDRNYFNLGSGFVIVLPGGLMPFFDFQALLGYSNLERYRFSGGLRIEL